MNLYPAIDIKDGKCVRLKQGEFDKVTVYFEDPVVAAKNWESQGGKFLHIVDLDGAVDGEPKNIELIKRIAASVNIPIQIGGGIRDEKIATEYLSVKGVERVILGTAAFRNPPLVEELNTKFPGRIVVGIDAKDGMVAINGWLEVTDVTAIELAKMFEGMGAVAIIYTDIGRDGMLEGPNFEATKELAEKVNIPIIASGGVASIDDLVKLNEMTSIGIEGAILGKSIYTGKIDLKEALEKVS